MFKKKKNEKIMILLTEWFPGKFQLPFSIARKYQEVGQLPVPGSSLLAI
jgi:hypothetical protein